VRVLDWVRRSAGRDDWFASDGVHLGSRAGIRAYTSLLRSGHRRGDGVAQAAASPDRAASGTT